jgi:hypothetical protein
MPNSFGQKRSSKRQRTPWPLSKQEWVHAVFSRGANLLIILKKTGNRDISNKNRDTE